MRSRLSTLLRATESWSSLVRLLVAVTALVAVVTASLLVLEDVTIRVGPVEVQRHGSP
ncbi:hypothetical protein ACFQV2_39035 [Actinokineospora soli]|uniref:Uncharacterized protein n=1 Tax=Actinokineospora soli TaxID=1048753 RepID=A0ABW2U098_9PSEU